MGHMFLMVIWTYSGDRGGESKVVERWRGREGEGKVGEGLGKEGTVGMGG